MKLPTDPLLDSTPAKRFSGGADAPAREPLLADEQRGNLTSLAPKKQYKPISKKRLSFRESSGYATR